MIQPLTDFALYLASRPKLPLSLRRNVAKALVPLDGRAFEVEIDGRPFEGRLDNYIEWVVFITRRHFEYTYLNLIRSLMQGGGAALDVGANVGNHTHAFASMFQRVLSFEPYDLVADRLERKAALLPNVSVYRVALSDCAGSMRFERPGTDNWGKGKIAEQGDIEVPVVVGDEYLSDKLAQPVDFIKVDVEGHELPVLRGLRQTIARDRPVVMFEVPKALKSSEGGDWSETMNLFSRDYSFMYFGGQSTFPLQSDMAKVTAVARSWKSLPRRATYLLAFGPERGFALQGGRLTRSGSA